MDINVDTGEGYGRYRVASFSDEDVFKYATSINLATGFHAGDPTIMWSTVKAAKKYNLGIGAHPGLQDLRGFGRRRILIDPEDLKADLIYQIGALDAFLKIEGVRMQHVKPHGALYVMAEQDAAYAEAIVEAVALYNPELILITERGTEVWRKAQSKGLKVVAEAFPDLAYDPNGRIIIERVKKAWDPDLVAKRALMVVKEKKIDTIEGKKIDMDVQTICIHGDAPNAPDVIKRVREVLENEGVKLVRLSEIVK
ncbi:MAG: hypothetical protein DJ555_00530 [Desulfurococcaceae archaeon]|nr:MAG: hypothetical protein DJ555_00530 [Desulfurococcaceae archaeon]